MPVDQQKRRQLLDLLRQDRNLTIKQAASRLAINYSTAKHIVKTGKLEASLPSSNQLDCSGCQIEHIPMFRSLSAGEAAFCAEEDLRDQ